MGIGYCRIHYDVVSVYKYDSMLIIRLVLIRLHSVLYSKYMQREV